MNNSAVILHHLSTKKHPKVQNPGLAHAIRLIFAQSFSVKVISLCAFARARPCWVGTVMGLLLGEGMPPKRRRENGVEGTKERLK
jgi:hypothetical protein